MQCLRILRSLARSTLPRAQTSANPASSPRAFSILSTTRPSILHNNTLAPPPASSPQSDSTPPALDLLPRISTHPSLASIQVRNGPRDTYNPSHRVRKRRSGFLSRLRTRKGRATLKRRQLKGRSTLSH